MEGNKSTDAVVNSTLGLPTSDTKALSGQVSALILIQLPANAHPGNEQVMFPVLGLLSPAW